MSILNRGILRRIRQHHAIEHATVSILMGRVADLHLIGGRSNHQGFFVYGEVETPALQAAAEEALARLQSGEASLAIHPNCGTNLVTSGTLAGMAAFTTSAVGRRQRASLLDQIPVTILAATTALILGRPLGAWLQRHVTTQSDVRDLRLGPISRREIGPLIQHFVPLFNTSERPA